MNAGFPEMKETGEASYQPAATPIQWQCRSSCQVMSHVARQLSRRWWWAA